MELPVPGTRQRRHVQEIPVPTHIVNGNAPVDEQQPHLESYLQVAQRGATATAQTQAPQGRGRSPVIRPRVPARRENHLERGGIRHWRHIHRRLDPIRRTCIWPHDTPALSRNSIWERVRICLNNGNTFRNIVRIDRIVQRLDGRIRYDLHHSASREHRIIPALHQHRERFRWHIKRYMDFHERRGGHRVCQANPPQSQSQVVEATTPPRGMCRFNVVTYNINGVRGKVPDLRLMMEQLKVDIIGIQETLLSEVDRQLRIPGYMCYSACGARCQTQRGVALLVKKPIASYHVGRASPTCTFVRCFPIHGADTGVIAGSVYVSSGNEGVDTLCFLQNQIAALLLEFPGDSFIIMGDFNRVTVQLERQIIGWRNCPGLSVESVTQADVGGSTRRSGRVIDHILTIRRGGMRTRRSIIDRNWDMSDHFPVRSKVLMQHHVPQEREDPRPIIKKYKVKEYVKRKEGNVWGFTNSNRFLPLLELEEGDEEGEQREEEGGSLGDRVAHVPPTRAQELVQPGPARESRDGEPQDREGPRVWPDGPQGAPEYIPLVRTSPRIPIAPERRQTLENLSLDFVRVIEQTAEEEGLLKEAAGEGKPKPLRRRVKRAIKQRLECFGRLKRAAPGSVEFERKSQEYVHQKLRTKRIVKSDYSKQDRTAILKAMQHFRTDPKAFYNWASAKAGWRRKNGGSQTQPIRNPVSGNLMVDSEGILSAWRAHYGALAADTNGHSKDRRYWQNKWRHVRKIPHAIELDENFSEEEVTWAILHAKRHKAPGNDGIPAELLKLLIEDTPHGKRCDLSLMGQAFIHLLRRVWEEEHIPLQWLESQVISIPKKGDMTDPGNYRGISLMSVLIKIPLMILCKRLNAYMEENNLFSPAQAGFRVREECPTQAGCLFEVCKRRWLMGKRTYVSFYDIMKAYDTVPHEAMLEKLTWYGVGGKMLAFITALYNGSNFKVRSNGKLSELAQLLRGLRQGDPLSTVLFNIYINDLPERLREHGVTIDAQDEGEKFGSLLFADDLANMTGSMEELIRQTNKTTGWMAENDLAVGVDKCMITVVGGDIQELRDRSENFKVGEQEIPIGDQYKYLGIAFRSDLDIGQMVPKRLELGRRALMVILPFLRNRRIPVQMRLTVMKAVLMPILMWGGEIYGMNKSFTAKTQVFVNQALKAIAGVGYRSNISNLALWREFNCPPVCARTNAARARAYQKVGTLSTHIKLIRDTPFCHRKWTWLKGTERWLNRYSKALMVEFEEDDHETLAIDDNVRALLQTGEWKDIPRQSLRKAIKGLVWRREERNHMQALHGQRYVEFKFDKTRVAAGHMGHVPAVTNGMGDIIKCRIGGYGTYGKWAKQGLVDQEYENICPFCGADEPETVTHLLLHCTKWDNHRDELIRPLLGEINEKINELELDPGKRDECLSAILLGGEYEGIALEGWTYRVREQGDVPNYDEEEPTGEENSSEGTYESRDIDPCALSADTDMLIQGNASLRVARFFSLVTRERMVTRAIWRQAPSNDGAQDSNSSASSTDRSPEGVG